MGAKPLHVGNKMPRRVVLESAMGFALAAAALVEQDDLEAPGVKEPPRVWRTPATRTAMKKDNWLSGGISAHFVEYRMPVRRLQKPGLIWLDCWIQ